MSLMLRRLLTGCCLLFFRVESKTEFKEWCMAHMCEYTDKNMTWCFRISQQWWFYGILSRYHADQSFYSLSHILSHHILFHLYLLYIYLCWPSLAFPFISLSFYPPPSRQSMSGRPTHYKTLQGLLYIHTSHSFSFRLTAVVQYMLRIAFWEIRVIPFMRD